MTLIKKNQNKNRKKCEKVSDKIKKKVHKKCEATTKIEAQKKIGQKTSETR